MPTFRYLFLLSMSLTLLLAACGEGQPPTEVQHPHTEVPEITPAAVVEPSAWVAMTLTDSKTGTTFKLSDYAGKVVILEMMDPFCYLCADQLKEIATALDVVGDKAVAVSADVGKGESALLKWGEENGVTWPLAIMPLEFRQALVAQFGSQVVAPSNTPVVIIDPSGIGHITERGIKKSETIVDLVNQWTQ